MLFRSPGYGLWFHVRDSKTLNGILEIRDERIEARVSKNKNYMFSQDGGRWIVAKIDGVEKVSVGCDVFNIEVEDDNSYIAEGVVVHNCQVPSLSKGKILDAVLRPLVYRDKKGRTANVYYCDLLVATERKHDRLVKEITSGQLNTLSMGTLCDWVTCSKCGKALGDNMPNCHHIDNDLLTRYTTKFGGESVVAELCGRVIWDKKLNKWVGDPTSNKFIEISWVERPAFCGAVLNHYVSELSKNASEVLRYSTEKLQMAVEDIFKLRVADKNGMLVLRVAQAEIARRMREDRLWKIAGRMV